MDFLFTIILVVHVLAAVGIVGLVLVQHGKGADMGAAFGSGASGSLFGATGSANFLSRSTGVAAAVFFATSIALTYYGSHRATSGGGVMQGVTGEPAKSQSSAPASTPAPAAPGAPSGSSAPKSDVPK